MAKTTFTYCGYTFEPQGQFKDYGIRKGEREMRDICRALHYYNAGCVADGDVKFDYDEFYKASGNCQDDIFLCKETGERYVPCAAVLAIFDRDSTDDEVGRRYESRRFLREEHERFVKQEALKGAMYFTEEQHQVMAELGRVVKKCKDLGLQFSHDGDYVFSFRSDLLKDLTEDMAPTAGQEQIPSECFQTAIYGVWDSSEGLYANVK